MFRTFVWIVLTTVLMDDCIINPAFAGVALEHTNKELGRDDISHLEGNFEVQKIAEGVYAAVRKEPPGLNVNANSAKLWSRRVRM